MASYPNVNAANKYAREVVAGNIVVCRFVRLACERHLNDLKRSKNPEYPYKFDKNKAERVCKFVQLMPHTKGEWSRKRLRLSFEGWQLFVFASIFGWVEKKTGLRRFTEAYCEVPRKNGKSAKSASVGHYMFSADGEAGAEVYCGATTEKQAWEVFGPAKRMADLLPKLRKRFNIKVWAKKLERVDGSKFEPIIGDPGDGSSPSCAIIDEMHEHPDSNLYDTMSTGMGAREQPLIFIITTAGDNINGPCYDMRNRVVNMLENDDDDRIFGIIYGLDEGDDWTTAEAIIKANPNLDVSVKLEYLLNQQQKAIKNPRFTNIFKTKHLNIWVTAKSAFFNMESWAKCKDSTLQLNQFIGEDCYIPVDMASKIDLAAVPKIFKRDVNGRAHYFSISPSFWVPEETISHHKERYLQQVYEKFFNAGYLTASDGAEIDYREIREHIVALDKTHPVKCVPIDPHGASALSHDLDDEGMTPITIPQNFTHMSDPMLELEAAIEGGRFHHDGNPIMTWCMSNVIGKTFPGSDDRVRPTKSKPQYKIDGAVALIMGVGQMMLPETSKPSIYSSGEVLC